MQITILFQIIILLVIHHIIYHIINSPGPLSAAKALEVKKQYKIIDGMRATSHWIVM